MTGVDCHPVAADVVTAAADAAADATVAPPETISAFASIDENSGPSPSAREPGDGLLVASTDDGERPSRSMKGEMHPRCVQEHRPELDDEMHAAAVRFRRISVNEVSPW